MQWQDSLLRQEAMAVWLAAASKSEQALLYEDVAPIHNYLPAHAEIQEEL